MTNTDVSEVLRATLINFGVSEQRLGEFDRHSSLELNFKNISPIFIVVKSNMIWMWSELRVLNGSNIKFHAGTLIDLLQHALPGVVTGQVVLGKGAEFYEVKALLEEECVRSLDKLSLALDEFYSLLTSIHEKLIC